MPTGTDPLRVSDADRQRVASTLLAAHGEGRLTLTEFDERVAAAHAAVVRADLAPLTADLPAAAPSASRSAPRNPAPWNPAPWGPAPCLPGGTSVRAAAAVWAVVSALNLLIWVAVVAGTGDAVYPWWIWVAGPWGAVLVLRAVGERVGSSRTPAS